MKKGIKKHCPRLSKYTTSIEKKNRVVPVPNFFDAGDHMIPAVHMNT